MFHQVLVVIVDQKSDSTEDELRTKVKPLESAGIHVIPVALGTEANTRELLFITPYDDNLITVKLTDEPDESAANLMDVVFKGLFASIFSYFHYSFIFIYFSEEKVYYI